MKAYFYFETASPSFSFCGVWKFFNSILYSLFHFLPQTLAFALGLYYLYGRIGFTFRLAECIFRRLERIFRQPERMFHPLEHKTYTAINRL